MTVSRRHMLTGAAALLSGAAHAERGPLIAAASSLQGLIGAFAADFERETGIKLRLVYGATANLLHQIGQGAPFELFLAADEASVRRLADAGLTVTEPKVFALGQLSLIVPVSSPLMLDQGLAGLLPAVTSGVIKRFAIANPELAPYGRAAEQALQASGVWEIIRPQLILAENIALAASLVATGGAQAGLTATSTLRLPGLAKAVRAAAIAADQHAPVRHACAALRGASPAALAVLARFTAPTQQARLAAHGFSMP